jgi:hypothetical protein
LCSLWQRSGGLLFLLALCPGRDNRAERQDHHTEAKEVVGGWAIMQYDTLEEAVADREEFAELQVKILARGHRDLGPASDFHGPGGARRLNGTHYGGLVPGF